MIGKPLSYSAAVSQDYQRKLEALVARMRKEYDADILRLYREFDAVSVEGYVDTTDASLASQSRIVLNELGRRWQQVFNRASKDIVDSFTMRLDNFTKRNAKNSLEQLSGGMTIQVPQWPGDLMDKVKASIAENVSLIKSIPIDYHDRLEGIVMRSIQSGEGGSDQVFKEAMKAADMTEKRAKLIAEDQTRKLTSALNVERMKSVGVTHWRWRHSGGGAEPRRLHQQLDGQVFSYADPPPVIDERTGERGYPGQLINCRCVQIPVLDFSEAGD